MGAANCCKKPEEIVSNDINNNVEGDKINAIEDSVPQDTEYVNNANVYYQEDKAQQEIPNQKLYEQEGSPKFGGAYEVAINSSSPVKYNQEEMHSPEIEIQNQQEQNEAQNMNQYSPEELAMYKNQMRINASPDSNKEEIKEYNQNDILSDKKEENLENQNQAQISIKQSNEPNEFDIQQFGLSNQGAVDIATLTSQKSEAPTNVISQVIKTQQIVQTPATNSKTLNIQQVPKITSNIQVQEAEEGEDLNKYFQIPTNLSKTKISNPVNVDLNRMQNIQEQNQSQKEDDANVASVTPIIDTEDINKYFKQISPVAKTEEMTDEQILNKYFTNATSEEIKPEQIIKNNINVENIINMKDLPPTFGSNEINNFKQTTTTTTTKTTGNVNLREIPEALTSSEIKKIIDMKDLPETLGSNQINNFKQTTTTTTTKTTGNVDLRNIPEALTSSQINKIIDMKDLPATFGSNDINHFKQTTTTTKTETTGNIPGALTTSEIKKIIDMKDLPETFGSSNINNIKKTTVTTTTSTTPAILGTNDINNLKQITTTTKTETTGNIPGNLTASEIKKIIDMKDLPETFGSSNINNIKKTTVTTTTSTTPAILGTNDINNLKQITTTTKTETTGNIPGNLTASEIKKIIDMKDLPETFGSSNINNIKKTTVTTTTSTTPAILGTNDINNLKQITTTTKTETTGNIPGNLTASEIKKIIDMKDLPETFGSSNINNIKKTTVTTTTTKTPANIDLKQFGLEQNPSLGKITSEPIDLKQFGLEQFSSQISTGQNKQASTTVTKTVQSNVSNPTEDYSKYFKNVQTTSNPIDLRQFGLEQNASNISNILQGSNITFNNPEKTVVSQSNYGVIPSASTPILSNNNYNQYFKTTKTTTTSLNKTGLQTSSNINPSINLNNYGISIPQGKKITTSTTTKTTGIPFTTTAATQHYTLPTNYSTNKISTTKFSKTYIGPTTQTASYNYSYNYPITGTTVTSVKK